MASTTFLCISPYESRSFEQSTGGVLMAPKNILASMAPMKYPAHSARFSLSLLSQAYKTSPKVKAAEARGKSIMQAKPRAAHPDTDAFNLPIRSP